jgi:CrcB protein
MNLWLAVFVGGGLGSVVRFALSKAVRVLAPGALFPWATLASNLLATALLAWLVMRWQVLQPGREHWYALLAVGFCGGFSTMSTFSLENHQLLREGLHGFVVLNVLVTLVPGVLFFHFLTRTPS